MRKTSARCVVRRSAPTQALHRAPPKNTVSRTPPTRTPPNVYAHPSARQTILPTPLARETRRFTTTATPTGEFTHVHPLSKVFLLVNPTVVCCFMRTLPVVRVPRWPKLTLSTTPGAPRHLAWTSAARQCPGGRPSRAVAPTI